MPGKKIIILYLSVIVILGISRTRQAYAMPDAAILLSPESAEIEAGGEFEVMVSVNTGKDAINAAEATILYRPEKLEVISISKEHTMLQIWVDDPRVDHVKGVIHFSGGIPSPGFKGKGELVRIRFKALTADRAPVIITSGSVLANDGKGSNILSSLGGGLYTIVAKRVGPQEQMEGSPASSVSPAGPEASQSLGTQPVSALLPATEAPPVSPASSQEPPEKDGQSAPLSVQLSLQEGSSTPCIAPTLLFQGEGAVQSYDVYLDNAFLVSIPAEQYKGYFHLPPLHPGAHAIVIVVKNVMGKAGFGAQGFNIMEIDPPVIQNYQKRMYPGARLEARGYALPGATVEFSLQQDAQEFRTTATVSVNEKGRWQFISTALVQGVYKLSARVRDRCGGFSSGTSEASVEVAPFDFHAAIRRITYGVTNILSRLFAPVVSPFLEVREFTRQFFARIVQ